MYDIGQNQGSKILPFVWKLGMLPVGEAPFGIIWFDPIL